jgi:large subunit ribosomal protein L7/L12
MPDLEGIVDRLSSLTVIEAAELAKMLEEKWGVSAAAPVVAQTTAAPVTEAAPEQSEFTVILTGFGDKKVQVVREVRAITSLGLQESMALVNDAPRPIKEGVSRTEADQIKAKIEAAGGTVEIK